MKLLIVAATWNEIKPLEAYLLKKDEEKVLAAHAIELLVTGPGSAFTAFHLGKILPLHNWDVAIQLGICGAFNKELVVGSVVNVCADTFADLGAEDDNNFLDVFELDLMHSNFFPFRDGWLVNNSGYDKNIDVTTDTLSEQRENVWKTINLIPKAKGITVNTVSGNPKTIEKLQKKYHADIESMEGAAFIYCCLKENIPCVQIRSVSNYIEKRDRSKWNIPLAIEKLNDVAVQLIESSLLKSQ